MLRAYLEEKRIYVDEILQKYLDELSTPLVIAEGMKYSVLNGGKRIRPILLFMVLEFLGADIKKGEASASALEMIHSYSLVHDDLPALDNDTYRRGKLTTHVKFGEAEGILIGDALLTHAFSVLTDKNKNILTPEQIIKIISLTANYSGINGMIGGQTVDVQSEGKEIEFDTLKYIHTNKTGKLIKLPVEVACIIADVDGITKKNLEKFAEIIGLAFQIRDDILDVEGKFEEIGKNVGSDEALKKSTYPSIFGMEESKNILNNLILEAKDLLEINFPDKNCDLLKSLVEFIGNRNN